MLPFFHTASRKGRGTTHERECAEEESRNKTYREAVCETEDRKQIADTTINIHLHNIYTDKHLSLGQKFNKTIDLNNGVYSFEFEGETYFYNKDTEEFMTSNGRAFTYNIVGC